MLTNSLLWELTPKTDDSKRSFLFGTMHVKDNAAYQFVDAAIRYLECCDIYFGEMDLKESQTEIDYSEYLIPEGKSLQDFIKPNHYEKLKRNIKKAYGIELDQLQHFKPLIILTKLSEAVLSEDNARPLDYFLWQKAELLNLELRGLEKVEEQVNTMRSLDLNSQIQMLRKALANVNSIRKSTIQLTDYYQKQNIKMLFKASKKSLGKFRKILLYERNKVMAERIALNLGNKSFYAIGAAHLAGQKGVLKYLKDQNVRVKALKI